MLLSLFLICGAVVLVGCGKASIDNTKQPIIDSLKTVLQAKTDITMSAIPDGDKQLNVDGKEVTIPAETFKATKSFINANNEIEQSVVDIVGSQVTDKNIATIIYYAQKYHINPDTLLSWLSK